MKTLNKMKDKLQREGAELRSARERVQDLSSRISEVSVSAVGLSVPLVPVISSEIATQLPVTRSFFFFYVSCPNPEIGY